MATFILSPPDSTAWERKITQIKLETRKACRVRKTGLFFPRIPDCGAGNRPVAIQPLLTCTKAPKSLVVRPTNLLQRSPD